MPREEVPLPGGNVSGDVVRVGRTVRKPSGPWTPAVDAFLCHLEGVGFEGAPRSFGVDERGRHVLEWIDGEVTNPYETKWASSPTLMEIGGLIRRLHDASDGFVPPVDACWQEVAAPVEANLIAHNDLAAWNFVHGRSRRAFIDWDLAAPSSRIWDLAWTVQSFAGIAAGADIAAVGSKVGALVDGYGLDDADRRDLAALLERRYEAMYDLLRRGHEDGTEPWARLWHEGHGTIWRGIADFTIANREALTRVLVD